MAYDIHARTVWSPNVRPESRAAAAHVPDINETLPWNPVAGVFIHYRGGDNPFGEQYGDEESCRRDIARIYEHHVDNPETFGNDIAYNFLVCRHGKIYRGRGYARGEANVAGTVWYESTPGTWTEIGRNEGFYSICALLRGSDEATIPMLQAIRWLIGHLRTVAPTRAGAEILPHSHEFATLCPGNLIVYAQKGSTIDPAVPWSGPADLQIYGVQKWVNRTYRDAPGYEACKELGYTGWDTVLSLTQGLQHELGLSPTVPNFGNGTFAAVKSRNLLPGGEYNSNLVSVYNAALWCKGYWASRYLSVWTQTSQSSLEQLYADAGLPYQDPQARSAMWPHVARALLRMDQFTLVPDGNPHVRGIQQRLNARYVARIPAMSLVPCDGHFSRQVQQGLMMAIQYELGIAPELVNGYFGSGTQAGLAATGSGPLTGDLRYLFRAACLFNSPVPEPNPLSYAVSDLETDTQTPTHTAWVRAFQAFSQIPVTGTNDYPTWAQLLVSTGDAGRPATGCDGITEITPARAAALWNAGYRIVGRYLDEHLSPDDPDYLGKALKPGEPQTIINAGLRLFPIFQYNGTQIWNFTYQKGYDQARTAHQKAAEHRLPAGTCIYFAVDCDALDVDIDLSIKSYFEGVRDALAALGNRYAFGVYGSRNVCSRISAETGARWSLVSGMSWGYSGNLGFPLPHNWSLNQIREYEFQPGWGLDHDVWRHNADPGVSTLDP